MNMNIKLPDYIPFRKSDKWGFCDKDKNIIIPAIYEEVHGFYNDEPCPVRFENKWGFIDKNNNPITPFKYDYAELFMENRAIVMIDKKYGFIDKSSNSFNF